MRRIIYPFVAAVFEEECLPVFNADAIETERCVKSVGPTERWAITFLVQCSCNLSLLIIE